jgi:hypothetical protein
VRCGVARTHSGVSTGVGVGSMRHDGATGSVQEGKEQSRGTSHMGRSGLR